MGRGSLPTEIMPHTQAMRRPERPGYDVPTVLRRFKSSWVHKKLKRAENTEFTQLRLL
jgi:hypothetical protein